MSPISDSNATTTTNDETLVVVADGQTGSGLRAAVETFSSKNRILTESLVSGVTIDAGTKKPVIPADKAIHLQSYLLNGSSSVMSVNGSVSSVNFDFTVPSGQTIYLYGIGVFILDSGTIDPTDFGSITGLTNGVDFKIRTNGTEYTVVNFKNNIDLALYFTENPLSDPGTSGFFSANDFAMFYRDFSPEMTLSQSTSDYVRMTIRDNLTAVDQFRAKIFYWRVP